MPDLLPISLDDMIVEVRRELRMRATLYPKWKADAGRNKRNELDRQWDVMEAILKYLEFLKALEGHNERPTATMDRE